MAIQSFADVVFPLRIAFGATGGPERRVEIVAMASGHERRNLRTSRSLRHYDVGAGVRTLTDLQAVLAFFEARHGPLQAFRFRDPFDHSSAAPGAQISPLDVVLGVGDGNRAEFPLIKRYGEEPDAAIRPITCARLDGFRLGVGGFEVPSAHWELVAPGGIIRFLPGFIPGEGAVVSAGFSFDVPVRFDIPRLSVSMTAFNAGEVPSIPLKEVLL